MGTGSRPLCPVHRGSYCFYRGPCFTACLPPPPPPHNPTSQLASPLWSHILLQGKEQFEPTAASNPVTKHLLSCTSVTSHSTLNSNLKSSFFSSSNSQKGNYDFIHQLLLTDVRKQYLENCLKKKKKTF